MGWTFRPAWMRLPAVGVLVVAACLRASAALAQTPAPTPTPTPVPGGENPSPASPDDSRVRAEVERQMKLAEANPRTDYAQAFGDILIPPEDCFDAADSAVVSVVVSISGRLQFVPNRYCHSCLPPFALVFMLRHSGRYVRHRSLGT